MTRGGDLNPLARFFALAADEPPLVYTAPAAAGELSTRLSAAVVVPVPAGAADAGMAARAADAGVTAVAGLDLSWILADLAARGVGRLMVEGGAKVLGQFLSAGLADEFLLAVAPIFVADEAAPRLLAGTSPGGRMTLAEVTQTGEMAVLRYLPGTGEPG
jgi:5-amino-6-(5-phosphoribosylamino)uracil reductase